MVFNEKVDNTDHLQFGSYLHRIFELGIKCTKLEELLIIAKEERDNYTFFESRNKEIKNHLMNFLVFAGRVRDNVIATEQSIEIPILDSKGKEVFSTNPKIDLLVQGKRGKILIVDFKTGKNEKTQFELLKDNQLRFYTMVVSESMNIPVNKVSASLMYTKSGRLTNPITYTPQMIASFKKGCIDDVWRLRKKKKLDLAPRLNRFCNWCQFKGLCNLHTKGTVIQENIKAWNQFKEQQKLIQESVENKD